MKWGCWQAMKVINSQFVEIFYFSNLNNSIQPCSLWKYLQIWLANCNQIHWEGIHFGTIQKAYQSRNKICKIPYNSITIFDELISKMAVNNFLWDFLELTANVTVRYHHIRLGSLFLDALHLPIIILLTGVRLRFSIKDKPIIKASIWPN